MAGRRAPREKSEVSIEAVRSQYEAQRSVYEGYADALRVLTAQLCKAADLPVDQVTARAKQTASVIDKMRRRNYRSLDQMVDKCGVRVIARYESTVEDVCELLKREFEIVESVEHGFEAPQSFGYTSRHLIVRLHEGRAKLLEWSEFKGLTAEIQVRSILQHAWASISHSLDYKSENEVPDAVKRTLYRVAALLETGDELFNRYRSETEALKQSYQLRASQEAWYTLPLDLESLLATSHLMQWTKVAEVAENAGWRDEPPTFLDMSEDFQRKALGRLVDIAVQGRLETVGELAQYAQNIDSYIERLDAICKRSTELGFTPWAIPPDIVALLIVSDHPELFRDDSSKSYSFTPSLWKAAMNE